MQLKSNKPAGIANRLKWVVYHLGYSGQRRGKRYRREGPRPPGERSFRAPCRRGAIVHHAISVVSSPVDLFDSRNRRIALLDSMPARCLTLSASTAEPTPVLLFSVASCHHSEASAWPGEKPGGELPQHLPAGLPRVSGRFLRSRPGRSSPPAFEKNGARVQFKESLRGGR